MLLTVTDGSVATDSTWTLAMHDYDDIARSLIPGT